MVRSQIDFGRSTESAHYLITAGATRAEIDVAELAAPNRPQGNAPIVGETWEHVECIRPESVSAEPESDGNRRCPHRLSNRSQRGKHDTAGRSCVALDTAGAANSLGVEIVPCRPGCRRGHRQQDGQQWRALPHRRHKSMNWRRVCLWRRICTALRHSGDGPGAGRNPAS